MRTVARAEGLAGGYDSGGGGDRGGIRAWVLFGEQDLAGTSAGATIGPGGEEHVDAVLRRQGRAPPTSVETSSAQCRQRDGPDFEASFAGFIQWTDCLCFARAVGMLLGIDMDGHRRR